MRSGQARDLLPYLPFFLLIFLAPFVLRSVPYRFAWATLAMLLLAWLATGRNARAATGLLGLWPGTWRNIAAALVLGGLVYAGASWLLSENIRAADVRLVPFRAFELRVAKPLLQSLNEEFVLRSLLLAFTLGWLLKFKRNSTVRSATPVLLCATLALGFSVLHGLYYLLLSEIILWPRTLLTLALVGFSFQALYLWSGHIYYTLAIHAGWNLVRFSGRFYQRSADGGNHTEYIPYAASFNMLEGSLPVLLFAAVMAVLSGVLLYKQASYRNKAAEKS